MTHLNAFEISMTKAGERVLVQEGGKGSTTGVQTVTKVEADTIWIGPDAYEKTGKEKNGKKRIIKRIDA